jgi:hypothetical protein
MHRAWLLSLALAGCIADGNPDPMQYSGETRRFVIDSIEVPRSNTQAREFGADLNGDKTVDNQLGMVTGTLASWGNITEHGGDMIAAGVIGSSIELIADNFDTDDTAALRYLGTDTEYAELVGGKLVDGRFQSRFPGTAIAHLPVFVDADPTIVHLSRVQASMVPDGRGGFYANIAGAIPAHEARAAAFASIQQMLAARPSDHVVMFRMLDSNKDHEITLPEFETNSLIASLLAPDVTLDGKPMLSIGFRVHIIPCAEGRCTTAPAAPTCFDRLHNGAETDRDCGGICGTCAPGATCTSDADCETAACDGTCAAPTCDDGVRDGHETDVDCGGPCGDCSIGRACWSDTDCASGMCGAPCTGVFCDNLSLDTCR